LPTPSRRTPATRALPMLPGGISINEQSCFIYRHPTLRKPRRVGHPLIATTLKGRVQEHVSKQIVSRVRRSSEKALAILTNAMSRYAREIHWEPIVEIVSHLPKEELAGMAEALVSLTSFKRHITRDAETVGGPIDVAVISRGDGFVWIKRKHYFDPKLNPHFFANYFYDCQRSPATT
jgi:hypothetical protein